MASADGAVRGRTQQSPLASQRAGEARGSSEGSTSQRRFPPASQLFPLGYKEGFAQWWSAVTPAVAEARVLSFLPFHHPPPALSTDHPTSEATASPPQADPHGPRECSSNLVPLSGKDRHLNEFSVARTAEGDPENHLVMLHGYGAGLGFYYRNYDMLSRRPGWKLWSLDLLGYGRSSRPPFVIRSKDPQGKISEAEDWFIDALEEWRQVRGIERFTLLGHSFGGYLSVRYALKYPDRVNKLILASPVGVPEDPYAVQQDLPDAAAGNGQSGMENELVQRQVDMVTQSIPNDAITAPPPGGAHAASAPASANGSTESLGTTDSSSDNKDKSAKTPPRRPIPKWVACLWDANVSPFSLVRWAGPLGPRLVSGWTSRRFGALPQDESKALHDYAYSLFRQRGSGEYALAYVLAPGAYARRPLLWRVQDLVKSGRGGIPSVWMYGEMDWMDVAGGFAAEEKIRNTPLEGKREDGYVGTSEWRGEKAGPGGEAKVLIVRNAGHHLYLDGWNEFNHLIWREMEDVEERERRWRRNLPRRAEATAAASAEAEAR